MSQELGVRAVMIGTLLLRGETLAVSVELVDGLEKRLLWGGQYTDKLADIFVLQEQIARQITEALRLKLTFEEQGRLARLGTENVKAYEYYLKGQFHGEGIDLAQAIPYYEQAIEEDPSYGLAYVALSAAHQWLGFFLTSEEHYRRARQPAERALEIDPDLAEAHMRMAEILAYYDRNWAGAKAQWNRAVESNPMLTSHEFTPLLFWMGRRDEAWVAIQRFAEMGDPLSAAHHSQLAFRYYYARKFDLAIEEAQRAKEIDPESSIDYLVVQCYEAKGMEEAAFQLFLSDQSGEQQEEYRKAFKESGMRGVRRRQLEFVGIEHLKPIDVAGSYALAGESDNAFEWLQKAYQLPVPLPFFTDARFNSLRDDPRYEQLLQKLNLPEHAIQRHLAVSEGTP